MAYDLNYHSRFQKILAKRVDRLYRKIQLLGRVSDNWYQFPQGQIESIFVELYKELDKAKSQILKRS